MVLRDPTITAVAMTNYDVVIVSYNYVMSRYRKRTRFLDQVAQANEHGVVTMPVRPNTSLFSEILHNFSDEKSQYLTFTTSAMKRANTSSSTNQTRSKMTRA